MFIPRNARSFKICRRTWCQWCCKFDEKKHMFKLRDGPVDWHCCSVEHAELWLHYRHKPKTHKLLRMLPAQRLEYLAARSIVDEILTHYPEDEECVRNLTSAL